MMRGVCALIAVTHALYWPLAPNGGPVPGSIQTFVIDAQQLWLNRNLYLAGNKQLNPAINRIIRLAQGAIQDNTTYTVTAKNQTAPSNSVADYYSYSRYYWPNTTAPNGLPYIRFDGISNPEIYSIPDSTWLQVAFTDIFRCSLAYFFTNDETFALRATKRLRDWFLNPSTAMNPNLNFANWIQGTNIGTVTGALPLLKTGGLLVIDGIGLIRNSQSFTQNGKPNANTIQDYTGMINWLSAYLTWLETSPRGVFESQVLNNQGTWYDAQKIAILLFLGQAQTATEIHNNITIPRILIQINPDGSQPLEQARVNSWFYSNFNLEGLFLHAALSKTTLANIYGLVTSDGRSLLGALDYLVGNALVNGTAWPVANIGGFSTSTLTQICKDAYVQYKDSKYLTDALSFTPVLSWNPYRLWAPFGAYDSKAALSSATLPISSLWIAILAILLF